MRDKTPHPIVAGLIASSPFAAFGGFSTVMAARHAASLFPFGGHLCGQAPLMHCSWCLAAPAAGAMAAAAFVFAATQFGRPAPVTARLD